MFLSKLKKLAETIGLACFALLAVYGLLGLVRGGPTAWAARSPAPAEAPHRSDGDTWDGATVPLVMNYQGTLHDAEGNPFTGYYTMTFRVYTDVIAPITSSIWSEQHLSVTVRGGRFNVLLGNVAPISNPIPADLFNDPDRFVGVQVAGYDEMVPRQRFASVPYAFHAFHATYALTATNSDMLDGQHAFEITPPGAVTAYAGETEPAGWLFCDGRELSRAEYPELFAAIGTAHGAGDGVTTFNLPDYRGRFLRGVDDGVGRDPDSNARIAAAAGGNIGNMVGSVQDDQMQAHKHNDTGHNHRMAAHTDTDKVNDGSNETVATNDWNYNHYTYNAHANLTDPVESSAGPVRYGLETRPLNAYVNWIIKSK